MSLPLPLPPQVMPGTGKAQVPSGLQEGSCPAPHPARQGDVAVDAPYSALLSDQESQLSLYFHPQIQSHQPHTLKKFLGGGAIFLS